MTIPTLILILVACRFIIPHLLEIINLKPNKQIKIYRDNKQKYPYYFTPKQPVHWFDFQGLINTFRRVSLSSDILSVIDKREVQANFGTDRKEELFENRKNKNEFWLDFIADTGDGFDATTTVFYHLTRDKFSPKLGDDLMSGDVLVIGGDLVYPDGSDQNYNDRLKGPIRLVYPSNKKFSPYFIAVPGNHDWYDGLTAFYRMMAQQNRIGNYKTIQNRSYFAYHVGFNKHIFGLDNQLKGDLDLPQVDYFKRYVNKICSPGSVHHIILLVAEPYWYSFEANDFKKRRQRMDSLDYFVNMIKSIAAEKKYANPPLVHIDVVITGDMHHYSHYQLQDKSTSEKVAHYITAGGGGAFGHVTSFLKKNLNLPKLGYSTTEYCDYALKNCYPSSKTTKQFIGTNFLFFWRNFKFTSLVIFLSFIVAYLQSITHNVVGLFFLIIAVPLILLGTVIQVANPEPSKKESNDNLFMYCLLFLVTVGISTVFFFNREYLATIFVADTIAQSYLLQSIIPAILQSIVMGLYFGIAYRCFGLHVTEVSSGKIQEGYKNFLKFKITKDEITIYTLGIKQKYNWWDLLKKEEATHLQEEMSEETIFDSEGEDEFLKKHFSNYKNNVEIIETIKIKTP